MTLEELNEEAKQEELRTRARRKLEGLARELNEKEQRRLQRQKNQGYCISDPLKHKWVILENFEIQYKEGMITLNEVFFYNKEDAKYALSQMTQQELEALK